MCLSPCDSASNAIAKHSVKCLQPCDSASNAVVKRSVSFVFIYLHCAEHVCLFYGLHVCG